MATATLPSPWTFAPGQRFVLEDVSWEFYEALLEELGDRHVRVSYDEGILELTSPTERHERSADLLAQMIIIMTMEVGIPRVSGGSTTFRREDLKKGIEPDRCYWLSNAHRVKDKRRLDLSIDPPPDLAIEVDITSSSLGRMGIYAGLGVPEVWRFDGERLRVHVLQPTGRYAVRPSSVAFPAVPMKSIAEFLDRGLGMDETEWLREFLAWFRNLDLARPEGAADDRE